MDKLIDDLFHAQPDVLFMIFGLVLIAIGVVGSIKSYIDPGKLGRIAALGIGTVLLVIGFALYAKQSATPVTSTVCTFKEGPLAGATHNLPHIKPQPIGASCRDMNGNRGSIVAPDTPLTPASTPAATPATTPSITTNPTAATAVTSNVCTFKEGPLAGATHKLPRAEPRAIGTACHDLKGNSGALVAPETPLTP